MYIRLWYQKLPQKTIAICLCGLLVPVLASYYSSPQTPHALLLRLGTPGEKCSNLPVSASFHLNADIFRLFEVLLCRQGIRACSSRREAVGAVLPPPRALGARRQRRGGAGSCQAGLPARRLASLGLSSVQRRVCLRSIDGGVHLLHSGCGIEPDRLEAQTLCTPTVTVREPVLSEPALFGTFSFGCCVYSRE